MSGEQQKQTRTLHRARAQLSHRQGRAPHRPGPWPSAAQTHPPAPCCGAVKPLTLRSLTATKHYSTRYSPSAFCPRRGRWLFTGLPARRVQAHLLGTRVPQGQFKRLQPIPPARAGPPGPQGSFRCLSGGARFCARPVCCSGLQDSEARTAPDSSPDALCPPPTPLPSHLSMSAGPVVSLWALLQFGALRDHASARDTEETTHSPLGSNGKHAGQAAGPASATVRWSLSLFQFSRLVRGVRLNV